jgi:putative transposase
MPRTARVAPGGYVYSVMNRSAERTKLFRNEAEFEAFQRAIVETHGEHPIRILAFCVVPTYWQFIVWPQKDGQVTHFFRWLAHAHAMRSRVLRKVAGPGHLYQGRFKNFPVQRGEHLLSLCRYVERIPLTAGLVGKAQLWPWSSLWARLHGDAALKESLSAWPIERPKNWTSLVNAALPEGELDRVRTSVERGRPFGADTWVKQTARELHMEHTIRPVGRPRKN